MAAAPSELHAARLLLAHRWAALSTLGQEGPTGSMVAYAPERGLRSLLLFLSTLSEHTRNLMLEPRVALVISEPDPSIGDPQTLARLSVKGTVHIVERTSPELEAAWRTYVGCFPAAASRRVLGDFFLFRLTIVQARYVAGLGQARTIAAPELSAAGLKL